MKSVVWLLFGLLAGSLCATHVYAQTSVNIFQDQATFLSSVSAPTLIDFEGIAAPDAPEFLGNPGVFTTDILPLIVLNNSQMFVQNSDAAYGTGSFLSPQGGASQVIQFILPAGTVGIGFSYSYANYGSVSAQVAVNVSGEFDLPPEPQGSMGFFGVTRDTAIGVVTLTVDGGAIDIDNIWIDVEQTPPPISLFADETDFLASVSNANLIDFEGVVAGPDDAVYYGAPGVFEDQGLIFSNSNQLWVRNIDGFYPTESFLQAIAGASQSVNIVLPPNTVAFGFSYSYQNWGSAIASANIKDIGNFVLFPEPSGGLGFFGMEVDSGIDLITLTVSGNAIDIDNVWFVVDPAGPPPEVFRDEADFLQSVSAPTLIDFEGVATAPDESIFVGDPGVFADEGVFFKSNNQLWIRNIDSLYGTGSYLGVAGGDPQELEIVLPENTIAFGLSYSYSNYGGDSASLIVEGWGDFYLPPEPAGGMRFFGVSNDSAIGLATLQANGAALEIDNVWFVVDPDAPPPRAYLDEQNFLELLNTPTLTDFEGVATVDDPLSLGAPGMFTDNGLTVHSNWFMFVINAPGSYGNDSYLSVQQGENPTVVTFEMPANTVAFGFSYAYANYGGTGATVDVDGSEQFVLQPEPNGQMGFFGIVGDAPIGLVTVTVDGTNIDLNDLWVVVDSNAPSPDFYRNEAAFLSEIQSPELIDFEGIVEAGESTTYADAFVERGVRISLDSEINDSTLFVQNTDYYLTQSYLSPQGANPQRVLIQLPPNTFAIGFSYNSLEGSVTINGTETYSLNAQFLNQLGFFGIIREQPIRTLSITVNDTGIDFDDIWFVSAPASSGLNESVSAEPDVNFGTDGILILSDLFQSGATEFGGLGIQPDGGIIIAGTVEDTVYNAGGDEVVVVAKLDLNGDLDPNFGVGGVRAVFGSASRADILDLSILPDGGILVSGRSDFYTGNFTSYLFKLNASGDLDPSFGDGGLIFDDLSAVSSDTFDGYERIVVREDGRILLGTAGLGVHRLEVNGDRDLNFGAAGIAFPNASEWASFGLAEAADESIVFGGGTAFFAAPQDFIVGRYQQDGTNLDLSFGVNGIASAQVSSGNDELLDLLIDSQGRIVTLGWTRHAGFRKPALVRFLQNGSIDSSFGWSGIRILDGVPARDFSSTRVILRPDDGFLLAGKIDGFSPDPSYELGIVSLHPDGSLDESFAGKGWMEFLSVPSEAGTIELRRAAMTLHPAGKIVAMDWDCDCIVMIDAPQWTDPDGDGVLGVDDNCPEIANADQANQDRDPFGNACDEDDDNDGVLDIDDAFPLNPGESSDSDGDGVGDNSDPFPLDSSIFFDVQPNFWSFSFVEKLSTSGITAGCGNNNYCPDDPVTRAQMAVFLERGINGAGFAPPAASGTIFIDVAANDFAASFIEQLYLDGITAGCGNFNYCPDDVVTRAQMAVFLLRAKYGSTYSPPPATGIFLDAPLGSFAAGWIEQLAAEGITAGCGNGNYCPNDPVTRAQMAVFLVRVFEL